MKMYKVLQLGKHYPPFIGGTERFIKELTVSLNRKGIRCDVLCANDSAAYEEINYDDYRVIKVPTYFRLASTSIAPHMITKLKEISNQYHIIHVHMPDPMANLALFFSQLKLKAKIILQWHMEIYRYRLLMIFYKPLLEWLFNRAEHIIVSSNNLREESEFSKFMQNKTTVIPLGIDINELHQYEEDYYYADYIRELSMGRKIVLSVGRLVYYKGFDVLINSAKFLPENVVILIAGDGPLKKNLEEMVEFLGLKGKVFLLGKLNQKQLVTCYKRCDVFCLPSKYKTEAFGIVQVEAMCFGKPVVSTKLRGSGVCEVNLHGETGLCVEPGDSKGLAEAIIKILENEENYNIYSKKAKERANIFSIERVTNNFVNIYEKVLQS
jgi:rhamnosyl/mannosyltransferase